MDISPLFADGPEAVAEKIVPGTVFDRPTFLMPPSVS
jgi:hypothetical protein